MAQVKPLILAIGNAGYRDFHAVSNLEHGGYLHKKIFRLLI